MARKQADPRKMESEVAPVDEFPQRPQEPQAAPEPAPLVEFTTTRGQSVVLDVRSEGAELRPGMFQLKRFVDGADYWDSVTNRRIWSIGRNIHDGRVEAAFDARYYGDPNWECLFLR